MWNTDFVFPSLLVLAVLLLFYFLRPRLSNRLNKAFLILVITDIATILLDIAASKADDHYQSFSIPLLSLLNLLYFVTYVARSLAFFRLAIVLLKLDHPGYSGKKYLMYLVFLVSEAIVLSSPLTHWFFRPAMKDSRMCCWRAWRLAPRSSQLQVVTMSKKLAVAAAVWCVRFMIVFSLPRESGLFWMPMSTTGCVNRPW